MKEGIALVLSLVLIGCNSGSESGGKQPAEQPAEQPSLYNPPTDSVLSYLNYLRDYAGLLSYSANSTLSKAALGHTNYQVNENITGHFQTSSSSLFFTGHSAKDRADNAGYKSPFVSENISYNKSNELELIDDLMTAIYHRMSLLDFDRNEIGFGFNAQFDQNPRTNLVWAAMTTKSGIAQIENLCRSGGEAVHSGSFFYCNDGIAKIKASTYQHALSQMRAQSKDVVFWPAQGATVPPVFYLESPDPLPECSVSGNPVSIQVNPLVLNDYAIIADSFVLTEQGKSSPLELVRILTNQTPQPDPGANSWQTDNKKWLAAFPRERLEWGRHYSAKIDYQYGGTTQTWQWTFSTPSLSQAPYRLVGDASGTLANGTTIYVYVPPQNCAVFANGYEYSVSYFRDQNPQVDIVAIDAQTYKLTLTDLDQITLSFIQSDGQQTYTRQMTIILND